MDIDQLTHTIIGAAIIVHRVLGPGLLESPYEECTSYELTARGIAIERQKVIPLKYKGITLDCCFRADMIVDSQVIVEFKSVARIEPTAEAQLLNYLRLTGLSVGLILNFHGPVLKDGIKRVVNGYSAPASRLGAFAAKPSQ